MTESDAKSRILTRRQIFESRFWKKVEFSDRCWEWTGARDQAGYGVFRGPSGFVRIHRLAVEFDGREIAPGMVVDHVCQNRKCVRPSHLEIVTVNENSSRSFRLSRATPGDIH